MNEKVEQMKFRFSGRKKKIYQEREHVLPYPYRFIKISNSNYILNRGLIGF